MLKAKIGESYLGLLPDMIDPGWRFLTFFFFLGLCKSATARLISLKLDNQKFVACRAANFDVNWMTDGVVMVGMMQLERSWTLLVLRQQQNYAKIMIG